MAQTLEFLIKRVNSFQLFIWYGINMELYLLGDIKKNGDESSAPRGIASLAIWRLCAFTRQQLGFKAI